jgi:hypothetical protein
VWSSKLGDGNDIARVTLEDLEGKLYGKVVKVLSRPIDTCQAPANGTE